MIFGEECPFCAYAEDGVSPVWLELFGESEGSDLVTQTDNFSVILDTAPVVRGHVLLITRDHKFSMAGTDGRMRGELVKLKDHIENAMRRAFGPLTAFEHGSSKTGSRAGACVDHAHLHFVPGLYDITAEVSRDFGQMHEFATYEDALSAFGQEPYLFYQADGKRAYAVEAHACSTQYLRRLVAAQAGAAERWNWRDCIRWHVALGLKDDLINARRDLQRGLQVQR